MIAEVADSVDELGCDVGRITSHEVVVAEIAICCFDPDDRRMLRDGTCPATKCLMLARAWQRRVG